MRYVLDTNVISQIMQPSQDSLVAAWFANHKSAEFATTAINQAEIFLGIALLPAGKKRQNLSIAAKALFDNEFANRIYPLDSAAALESAAIRADRTKRGMPISFQDACIAAIAKEHDAAVVTRDSGGFAQTGVQVVNPWEIQ